MEALLAEAVRKRSAIARTRALYEAVIIELGRRQMNCAAHGPFFECIFHVPTRRETHYSACPECLRQADKLNEEREARKAIRERERELERRLIEAALPQRFAGRTLDEFCTEQDGQRKVHGLAHGFAIEFASHRATGRSLVFAGTPGTGKTLLSVMLLHEICRQGYRSRYTTCHGLVSAVRRTWGSDGEGLESDVLDSFASPSLLILDEIGIQAGTDSEKSILFDVIDRRYSERRPTIFVTNLDVDGLRAFFGDRIWDRLVEIVKWVPFSWPSYRPRARRELVEEV